MRFLLLGVFWCRNCLGESIRCNSKYFKCLMKVSYTPFTSMIDIYLYLVYYLSLCLHLFCLISFFWKSRVELVRCVC